MRAVDTNVLVRLIIRNNHHQTAAAEAFIQPGAWVPLLAVAETIWVLANVYERGVADQASAIDLLLNNQSLVLQESATITAALHLFRVRPSLGFSDCLMIESARKAGHLPLGTFDRALARVEGAHRL